MAATFFAIATPSLSSAAWPAVASHAHAKSAMKAEVTEAMAVARYAGIRARRASCIFN
jgi:hypothetical protein